MCRKCGAEKSWTRCENVSQKYARWEEALERRDLKVNIKIKAMKVSVFSFSLL